MFQLGVAESLLTSSGKIWYTVYISLSSQFCRPNFLHWPDLKYWQTFCKLVRLRVGLQQCHKLMYIMKVKMMTVVISHCCSDSFNESIKYLLVLKADIIL